MKGVVFLSTKKSFSRAELEELSKIELNTIDYSTLKELTEIKIDPNAPIEERLESFFDEIGNPYCFLVNGTPVQISFNNHKKTLDNRLFNYLTDKKNAENDIP